MGSIPVEATKIISPFFLIHSILHHELKQTHLGGLDAPEFY